MAPTQTDFVRVFEPLERIFDRSAELSRQGPAQGSRAARDGRTKLGRLVWDLGAPANAIGLDHLVAWRMLRLKGGFQPGFAHLTLLRGALEGTAITRWLCDQTVGTDERIRRAAGVQRADYEQRMRFERRMAGRLAKPTGEARSAVQRVEALEQLIRKQHVKPIEPNATELIGRYALPTDPERLAGESLYRLISGVAHSKVWSLFGISERGELLDLGGGRFTVKLSANDDLALGATAVAMRLATEALADLEWYAGAG